MKQADQLARFAKMLPWLSLAASLAAVGCNATFYQPDHVDYREPAEAKLTYTDLAIPTADGLVLHGWDIQPRGVRRGMILHFHGNAQNMSAHLAYVEWLADEGYEIITFDYRGYGKSPGSPTREGLVLDGVAAITQAKMLAASHGLDLFILAQSLGGAVAIPALDRAGTSDVRALIVESSFGSYRDMARVKLSEVWLTWPLQWPLSFLVTDDYRAADAVARLQLPLLLIHGDRDDVVPFAEGKRLFAAAGPGSRDFWTVAHGGHTSAFVDGSPYRNRLVAFLREHAESPGADVHANQR